MYVRQAIERRVIEQSWNLSQTCLFILGIQEWTLKIANRFDFVTIPRQNAVQSENSIPYLA